MVDYYFYYCCVGLRKLKEKEGEGIGGVDFAFLRGEEFGRYGFERINPLNFVNAQISQKWKDFEGIIYFFSFPLPFLAKNKRDSPRYSVSPSLPFFSLLNLYPNKEDFCS